MRLETYRFSGNQLTPVSLEGVRFEKAGEYVLLRITQYSDEDEDHVTEDRLWTAPIWFEEHAFHTLGRRAAENPDDSAANPDPLGDDFTEEQITLKNEGVAPVNLSAWKLRDLAENSWPLDGLGTIGPGSTVTIKRNGAPMALNNGGDTVELVAPDGTVVQTVDYGRVGAGEEVIVNGPPRLRQRPQSLRRQGRDQPSKRRPRASRNLVILLDGTGNQLGRNLSNVLKLYRVAEKKCRTAMLL